MLLAETVNRETADFPKEEIYGLTRQIKTSAISVPSNIAEVAQETRSQNTCISLESRAAHR